jgi:hypothetical protein
MKHAILQFPAFASLRVLTYLQGIRVLRKAIRFSRSYKIGVSHDVINETVMTLHMEAIQRLNIFPGSVLPFPSLQVFAPDAPGPYEMPYHQVGRVANEIHQYLHIFLTLLAILHLPNAQSGSLTLFPLSCLNGGGENRDCRYTSKDVMLAVVRAFGFLADLAYTPISPDNPVLSPFFYSPPILEEYMSRVQAAPVDPLLCSPLLCEATSGMMIYIVSSSSLISARAAGPSSVDGQKAVFETEKIVREKLLPCTIKLSSLWPIAKVFAEKISEVLEIRTWTPPESII